MELKDTGTVPYSQHLAMELNQTFFGNITVRF